MLVRFDGNSGTSKLEKPSGCVHISESKQSSNVTELKQAANAFDYVAVESNHRDTRLKHIFEVATFRVPISVLIVQITQTCSFFQTRFMN